MTEIKTLADELREKIRNKEEKEDTQKPEKRKRAKSTCSKSLEELFNAIQSHQLSGHEKILIRLDDKTVFLMKQLKVSKGIDMNRLISYSIKTFLENTPELTEHIKQSLKNLEL